jgi:transposase-like protein
MILMAPANRKDPKRSTASESGYSLMEFMRDFSDDEACLQWLWRTRCETGQPNHAHCPRCEEIREFKRYGTKQQRQSWTCTACGLHMHPTAGTIFHKSSTSLHLWFYAMWLMTSTRCGISAKQLERELGVTYKTAWRMFTLIRNELMTQDDTSLSGEVEMDETYVGGKLRESERPKYTEDMDRGQRIAAGRKAYNAKTTPVFGMVERGGKVAAYVVPSVKTATLAPHIQAHVEPSATVYTDDATTYQSMRASGWDHHTIDHSARVYVSGNVHTQTIDGFWSLVKRGISGTHHAVSPKWLQGYLNEYVWRYNHHDDERSMFLSLILRAAGS